MSFVLLALLKAEEVNTLSSFYRADKVIKLQSFAHARAVVKKSDLELLELWESILTGRSAPLSKMMKKHYKSLGLNHIFTPSGFHLSAVLFPFMALIKNKSIQLMTLITIGISLTFLPGFGALKRMVLIKSGQKLMGLHLGFILALILDVLFGSFQQSALSFTYSFLFLGIIYGGMNGLLLNLFFFSGQILIAYFQGNDISPLLLIFSPILNLIFAALMPLLFLLSFPLWEWQLNIGILLLKYVQILVDICAELTLHTPSLEVSSFTLLVVTMLILKKWKCIPVLILIFSTSLNIDHNKAPGSTRFEFVPRGDVVKRVYSEKFVTVYFREGNCRMKLVRGFWYENCSPKRRSSRKKKIS